jgi:hypothetical protein
MARRLKTFPDTRDPRTRRYPWNEWLDGSVWEIRRGEDYDVTTENMRVTLHMKADSRVIKVRTKKVHDQRGEGLVFEFFDPDQKEAEQLLNSVSDGEREAALNMLYDDAMNIYERARAEVTIPRNDGTTQKYAAVRYKQEIEKTQDNKALLVPTIARIIRRPTSGFNHLATADRPDLMVETLVLDETKPYHRLFVATTIETARQRLQEYGY